MIAFQLSLVGIFLAVAYWLDRENRRTNRINVGLVYQNDSLRKDCERLGGDNAALAEALNARTGELEHLRFNEQFARECMRDSAANRDELYKELCDERRRAYELTLELDAYREEEQMRAEFRRVIGRAVAN